MLDQGKGWFSLITGLLVLALGVIPFLQNFNVIAWGLPSFVENWVGAVGIYIIAALGLYLLIDAFMEHHNDTLRTVSIIVSLLFIAAGIISALHAFGVIGWAIPFLSYTVFNVLFIIEGIFLVIAGFAMQ